MPVDELCDAVIYLSNSPNGYRTPASNSFRLFVGMSSLVNSTKFGIKISATNNHPIKYQLFLSKFELPPRVQDIFKEFIN